MTDPRDRWIAQLTQERDAAYAALDRTATQLERARRSLRRANIGAGIIFAFCAVAWLAGNLSSVG